MNDQTVAYWPTRIMLAIGVGAAAAAVLYALWPAEPCFGCTNPDVLDVPSALPPLGSA